MHEDGSSVAGGAAREEYRKNKQTQHNSKAKNLLYGLDSERPITPLHCGKKSVPHLGEHHNAPFATYDGTTPSQEATQGGQMIKTFQAKGQKKDGAGKVSALPQYSSDVYRSIMESNHAERTARKARNWGSAGLLGQHPATPATVGAGQLEAMPTEEHAEVQLSRPQSALCDTAQQ